MRIHKLIPILALLIVPVLTTIPIIKHSRIAVEPVTASAQEKPKKERGFSTFQSTETKEERACDLYLDAAEVERRAKEEKSGSEKITSSSRIPISFEDVALPLAGGIDHVVAGVGTRNSGSGVIRLRGVPPGAQLVSALLVWGEITNQPNSYSVGFGSISTSPATFTGNVYGVTQEPCWGFGGQYAGYITNVTSAITPGINGDYLVKGLRTAITDGRCAWFNGECDGPGNTDLVLSEGASLIVLYTHSCVPSNAQIYIHLGPTMFAGAHTVTHSTLTPPIIPNMVTVKHSRIGGDGQVSLLSGSQGLAFTASCGLNSSPEVSDERTWIVNSLGSSIQIKGDGSGLNRDSDWNGYDGEPFNKLWDTHTSVFLDSSFLAVNGGLNYSVRYQAQFDCVVWAVHILGIR